MTEAVMVELLDKGMLLTTIQDTGKGHHNSLFICKKLACDITQGGGIRVQATLIDDTPVDILYNGKYFVFRSPTSD